MKRQRANPASGKAPLKEQSDLFTNRNPMG
jgi:hypothetical protein